MHQDTVRVCVGTIELHWEGTNATTLCFNFPCAKWLSANGIAPVAFAVRHCCSRKGSFSFTGGGLFVLETSASSNPTAALLFHTIGRQQPFLYRSPKISRTPFRTLDRRPPKDLITASKSRALLSVLWIGGRRRVCRGVNLGHAHGSS